MKHNHIYILTFFLFIGFLNAQVFEFLNHTYEYIPFTGTANWDFAIEDALSRGGYLATVTKQAESDFISNIIIGTSLNRPFIAGSSLRSNGTKFYWEAGPESDELFYNRNTNKAYGFNYWAPNQPDRANPLTGNGTEFYVNLHPKAWNDYQINATAVKGYLLEKGGETDPFMTALETNDIEIIFKNVIGASKIPLSVYVASAYGKKISFICPFKKWLSDTSFSCKKQYTMAGEYNITITDNLNYNHTILLAHPSLPYVSAIIPSMVKDGIITINGENFSDDITDLIVYISSKLVPCLPQSYILPHRSFTCVLTEDLYPNPSTNPNLALITVGVNGVYLANRTRIPFYNSANDHLVMQGGNFYYEVYNTYNYEGKTAVSFTPIDDYVLLGRLENYPQCFETTYDPLTTSYLFATTVKQGQALISINPTTNVSTCNSAVFPGCGTVDGGVVAFRTVPLGFLASTSVFYSPSTTARICKLQYLLNLPTYNPSLPDNPKVYLVPTSGGRINIAVNGLRLTSSNYTMTQGLLHFPQTLNPNWDEMSLELDIPPGSGSYYLSPGFITVYVDGKSSGLSQSYVAYAPPDIISMDPEYPPTSGGLLTIIGEAFGNITADIFISIEYPNGTILQIPDFIMITQHEVISFIIPPGSGSFTIRVTADDQSATYATHFAPPTFIDVVQNQKLLQLTVDNILLSSNKNLMFISLNSVNLDYTYINSTSLSLTLPDDSYDGPLVITVDGISSTYNLTLKPILTSIEWVQSGQVSTLNGFFFYQPKSIVIGSNIFIQNIVVLSTNQITCTPIGTGFDLSTTIELGNSLLSNSVLFSYSPVLSDILHDGEKITITGNNFDSDSIINLKTSESTSTTITPLVTDEQTLVASILTSQVNTMVTVTSNTMTSQSYYLRLTPHVTDVSSVPSEGGQLTVTGTFLNSHTFNGTSTSMVVNLGPSLLCKNPIPIDSSSNEKILCQVDSGTGSDLAVKVNVDGLDSNTNILFSYDKPAISNVKQSDKQLFITGNNFGINITVIQVTLNSQILQCSFNLTYSLVCVLEQSNESGALNLTVSNQNANTNVILKPILTNITPTTSESTSVTIFGWFLRTQSQNTYSGLIGNGSCSSINTFTNRDYLICNLLNSNSLKSSTNPLITINIVGEVISSNSIEFEYSIPNILSINQNEKNINIIGNTLGNTNSIPTIQLGLITFTQCIFVQYQNEISCPLPLTSQSGDLNLTNYQGSDQLSFTITPILTTITSTPTIGGTVEISGILLNDLFNNILSFEIIINNNITNQCLNPIANTTIQAITCQVPTLLSDNSEFKIILTQSQLSSNSLTFNYDLPSISTYIQNEYNLIMNGDNLGYNNFDNITLTIENIQDIIDCEIVLDNTQISCDLSNHLNLLNGNAKVTRNSQVSLPFYLSMKPILKSIIGDVDPKGSNSITIKGEFLSSLDSSSNANSISIFSSTSGNSEFVKSIDSQTMIINVLSGSHGTANEISIEINQLQSNTIIYKASNPNLLEVLTNGKLYYPGDGGLVTIKGSNFIKQNQLVTVSIGQVGCTSPVIKDFNEIICFFNATAPPDSIHSLLVEVICDNLKTDGYLFLYSQSTVCKGTPQCLGQGSCFDGACLCNGNYSGAQCEINGNNSTKLPPETVNPDSATFSKDFSVFFTHIREIDTLTQKTVLIYPITSFRWNITKNTTTQIQSIGSIENETILIKVNSTLFKEPSTISFAGEVIKLSTNSLKYQIGIENWTFESPANSLELIYAIESTQSQVICDETISSNQTIDNTDDIRTITVQLNGQYFTSQFSKRILSDNRVTISTTKLLSKSDSIYKTSFYQKNPNQTVVAMVAPSFTQSTIIDPSFQLLIQSNFVKTEDGCGSTPTKTKSLWWISLIVVGGVGSAAGVTGFLIHRKRQLKNNRFLKELQSTSN